MTFDDLQQQWQQSNESATNQSADTDSVVRTVRRVEKSKSTLFRRDLGETIAAVVLVYLFGKDLFIFKNLMVSAGNLIMVCGMVFIIYKLHRTRWVWGSSRLDLTVREFCSLELQRVEKQIELLRNVGFWYLAPCFVGVNFVFAGHCDSLFESLAYFLFVLLLYWYIYALNQWAVDKQFVPLQRELQATLSELEESNINDPPPNT